MEFHESAFKHGETKDSVQHALDNVLLIVDLEPDSDPPRVLAVGPDRAGNLLEVIWLELAAERNLVIHAMRLRRSFYNLLAEGE